MIYQGFLPIRNPFTRARTKSLAKCIVSDTNAFFRPFCFGARVEFRNSRLVPDANGRTATRVVGEIRLVVFPFRFLRFVFVELWSFISTCFCLRHGRPTGTQLHAGGHDAETHLRRFRVARDGHPMRFQPDRPTVLDASVVFLQQRVGRC